MYLYQLEKEKNKAPGAISKKIASQQNIDLNGSLRSARGTKKWEMSCANKLMCAYFAYSEELFYTRCCDLCIME